MKLIISFCFVFLSLLCSADDVLCSADDVLWDDQCVEMPFSSPLALQNFKKLLPKEELSEGYLERLKYIERYGYVFSQKPIPYTECPSAWVCPEGEWFVAHRIRQINLFGLLGLINKALEEQNSDACSSIKTGGASISFAQGSVVEFRAPISFTQRWCANGLTGDLSNGSGTIVMRVFAAKTFPSYSDSEKLGSIDFIADVNIVDVDATIFGLFDYQNFVGELLLNVEDYLGKAITGDSIKGGVDDAFKKLRTSGAGDEIARGGNAVLAISRHLPKLYLENQSGTKISYLEPDLTFFYCTPDNCFLQVTEALYIFSRRMELDYNTLGCEIEIIRSLKNETGSRTIISGESLWMIARKLYCHGEMYLYILNQNPELRNSKRLMPGQIITVNPLFTYLTKDKDIIKSGDSLWKRWLSTDRSHTWSEYSNSFPGSSNPNLIYPLQLDEINIRSTTP